MNRRQLTAMRNKLAEIEKRDGKLTPEAVVAEAKNPKSVLHRMFEWNIKKAAYQHWLDQARELIVSVRYVYEKEGIKYSAPTYIRDPDAAPHEQGYRSIMRLKSDRDLAHEALVSEFARAAAHLTRAHEIAKALEFLTEEVAAVAESVGVLRSRVASRSESFTADGG